MADPNSMMTRARLLLVQWLDPSPDNGEAWCVSCTLNGGRTLIVPAPGHLRHVELHREQQGNRSYLAIRVNWGQIRPPDEEDEDLSCRDFHRTIM
jgi:hypothetical protein